MKELNLKECELVSGGCGPFGCPQPVWDMPTYNNFGYHQNFNSFARDVGTGAAWGGVVFGPIGAIEGGAFAGGVNLLTNAGLDAKDIIMGVPR